MKVKVKIVTCTHETKYGVDTYTRVVKKNETEDDVISAIMRSCDYNADNPGTNEYFDSDITELILDTDEFEAVE